MPNRILRDGIVSSERVCSLSWVEEVFYRRLHSVVDDFGRYYAKAALLRAACYPLQLDKTSDSDIAKWLAAAQGAGLVRVYSVKGKDYLELVDFRQQVRAKASKFPVPPASASHLLSKRSAHAHLDVDVDVDVDGVVDEVVLTATAAAQKSRPPKQNGKLKINFNGIAFEGISEEQELRWQDAYPAVPIPPAIAQAAAWLEANPANRKSNCKRFLVNWFKREQDKAGRVKR